MAMLTGDATMAGLDVVTIEAARTGKGSVRLPEIDLDRAVRTRLAELGRFADEDLEPWHAAMRRGLETAISEGDGTAAYCLLLLSRAGSRGAEARAACLAALIRAEAAGV